MNEVLFFIHILILFGFALGALKIGKEALMAWVAVQAILANLFVLKQIFFLGFNITCSDVFAIGCIWGLNLLREYYGKECGKTALRICFFCMIFFVAMAKIHLLYAPSTDLSIHAAYAAVLSSSPRLLFASIAVFFIVQKIDLQLFSGLKERFPRVPFLWRNGFCLSVSQLLDTVLFTILGLWGLVASLSDIIIVSFALKLLIISVLSPLTALFKRWVPVPRET